MLRLVALVALTTELITMLAAVTGMAVREMTPAVPTAAYVLELLVIAAWPGIPGVAALIGVLRRAPTWIAFGAPTPGLFGIWWATGAIPLPDSSWPVPWARVAGVLLIVLAVVLVLAAIDSVKAKRSAEMASGSQLTTGRDASSHVRDGVLIGFLFTGIWLVVIVFVIVSVVLEYIG